MADPVAPQPMMATLARLNFCCPPNPIPENKTCREYLSSSSKEVTRFGRLNLYYRGIRRQNSGSGRHPRGANGRQGNPCAVGKDNIAKHGNIELVIRSQFC